MVPTGTHPHPLGISQIHVGLACLPQQWWPLMPLQRLTQRVVGRLFLKKVYKDHFHLIIFHTNLLHNLLHPSISHIFPIKYVSITHDRRWNSATKNIGSSCDKEKDTSSLDFPQFDPLQTPFNPVFSLQQFMIQQTYNDFNNHKCRFRHNLFQRVFRCTPTHNDFYYEEIKTIDHQRRSCVGLGLDWHFRKPGYR